MAADIKQLKMIVMDKLATKGVSRLKRRHVPDVAIRWNGAYDVALSYNLHWMMDRGLDESQWSANRLRREVFYFDSITERFELSKTAESTAHRDRYRWAQVIAGNKSAELTPTSIAVADTNKRSRVVVPASASSVIVVYGDLDWDELEWAPKGVHIRGTFYALRTVHVKPTTAAAAHK